MEQKLLNSPALERQLGNRAVCSGAISPFFYFLHRIWKDPGALCGFNPVPRAMRLSSALPPSPHPGAGPEQMPR